ncbi:hypothetical protein ACFW1A_01505 [Kitasatospora sp. NPDC058965]|uniref:hypothetical protein n=1 Tax=Kitasatospora sp. NPDC058965 TaxID=3346682 RepID=UPI003696A3C0
MTSAVGGDVSAAPDGIPDVLGGWVRERGGHASAAASEGGALRFAFYGRVSTEDHQDPATSRAWQLLQAESLVSGHGRVVAELFDVGHSRALPWARRPEAGALLAALTDPDPGGSMRSSSVRVNAPSTGRSSA